MSTGLRKTEMFLSRVEIPWDGARNAYNLHRRLSSASASFTPDPSPVSDSLSC